MIVDEVYDVENRFVQIFAGERNDPKRQVGIRSGLWQNWITHCEETSQGRDAGFPLKGPLSSRSLCALEYIFSHTGNTPFSISPKLSFKSQSIVRFKPLIVTEFVFWVCWPTLHNILLFHRGSTPRRAFRGGGGKEGPGVDSSAGHLGKKQRAIEFVYFILTAIHCSSVQYWK